MIEDLYEHQRKALEKLSNGKILWGGVGTGKSRVAAEYYRLREAPRDVYVITTAKKRDSFDWQEEFYRIGVGPRSGPVAHSNLQRKQRFGGSEALGAKQRDVGNGHVVDCSDRSGLDEASGLLLEGDRRRQDPAGGDHRLGRAGIYPYVLTVDSWNNITKYANTQNAFFIFDEQRLVGSGDWTRKFLRIAKHNRWILLSGTPGDTWMDYIPVFVANDFYKNRTVFKREHVVYNTFTKFPKVDRYINVGRLARQRAQLLVEMPYERHTKRRVVEVPLRYDKEMLDTVLTKRWNVFEERPLRDVAEMCTVARRVVNGDPSRLEMVCELWKNHPKLIVFYNYNYELESLRSLKEYYGISSTATGLSTKTVGVGRGATTLTQDSTAGSSAIRTSSGLLLPGESVRNSTEHPTHSRTMAGTMDSGEQTRDSIRITEWNGHKHQAIPETDRWLYLVQYTAGAEGWNCIETNAMIFYSRNYSWKVWEQAKGRIDRLNTPFDDLWYYDFTTDSWIDRAIGRALKAKKTFNEAQFSGLFKGVRT